MAAVTAAGVGGCTRIIAVDPDPRRRERAVASGAADAVDPSEDDVVAASAG